MGLEPCPKEPVKHDAVRQHCPHRQSPACTVTAWNGCGIETATGYSLHRLQGPAGGKAREATELSRTSTLSVMYEIV